MWVETDIMADAKFCCERDEVHIAHPFKFDSFVFMFPQCNCVNAFVKDQECDINEQIIIINQNCR